MPLETSVKGKCKCCYTCSIFYKGHRIFMASSSQIFPQILTTESLIFELQKFVIVAHCGKIHNSWCESAVSVQGVPKVWLRRLVCPKFFPVFQLLSKTVPYKVSLIKDTPWTTDSTTRESNYSPRKNHNGIDTGSSDNKHKTSVWWKTSARCETRAYNWY